MPIGMASASSRPARSTIASAQRTGSLERNVTCGVPGLLRSPHPCRKCVALLRCRCHPRDWAGAVCGWIRPSSSCRWTTKNVHPFGSSNSHSRAELFCDTALAPIPLFGATCFVQSGRKRRAAVRQIALWSGREPMRTKWLLIALLLVTFGNTRDVVAQVGDLAGVLPGDRWVYEVKDEITGDLKRTTTVVVL